jgi:DNA-directed RNA polymerase subunit E'/Rpb7
MDPLFERRELTRSVHMDARFMQRNIQASLLAQLQNKYEGICVAEGYIQPRSITIVEHSLGRTNLIKGGLDYSVRFQADVCMPHSGQVFRAPVSLKSKIGVHAEIAPLKILLPRDLHIGLPEFEAVEEKQEVEFEVVGSRFQQGDESIVVLGKLRNAIRPQIEQETAQDGNDMPMIAAPTGAEAPEGKKVVTVEVGSTKISEPAARRKRVRLGATDTTNEQKSS